MTIDRCKFPRDVEIMDSDICILLGKRMVLSQVVSAYHKSVSLLAVEHSKIPGNIEVVKGDVDVFSCEMVILG